MTFTSFNRGGSFQPEQVSSPLQSFDENTRRQQAAEQQYLQGMRANDAARLRDLDKAFSGLSQLSTAITQYAEQKRDEYQKKEMQRGMALAYTNGVSQADRDDLDEQERQGQALDKETTSLANKVESDGDPYTADNIRKMSAWAQYGFAVQTLQMGGMSYGIHFADKRSTTKVNIDGQEYTYDTARTPEQRAAVQAQIRQDYLDRFAEFNPVMAAKYMFPAIQKFEEKEAVKWATAYSARQKDERLTAAKDSLYSGLVSEMGGDAYLNLITNKASDFGGTGAARKAAAQMLIEMIDNEQISETQVRALMRHEFDHRGMGRTTIGKAFQRDFVEVESTLRNVRQARSTRAQKELTKRRFEFSENLRALFAERAASGVPLTDDEKADITRSYQEQGLGLNVPELKNYETAEDRAEDEARELLEAKKAVRGYYIESDLNGMPTSVRAAYIDQVKKDTEITSAGQDFTSGANKRIEGKLKVKTQFEEGKTSPVGGFEEYQRVLDRAQRDYQREFRSLMLSGKYDAESAYELAIDKVNKRIDDDSYLTFKARTNTDRQQQLVDLRKSLIDPNSPPAAGLVDEVAQAVAYFQTQAGNLPEGEAPVRTLPEVFNIAASGTSSTGIDVALSELAKRGIVGFKKPAVEQKVDELSPSHQALLRKNSTQGRFNRVMTDLGAEAQWAADLVMSGESKAFGGFNAFNKGGADNGYTAFGSGDSSKDLDMEIVKMTLGEIKRRHALPFQHPQQIFATGGFQFIPKTFIEVQNRLGLSDDEVFTPQLQLEFFLERLRQRVSWGGGTQGLINEWRALKFVSESERQRLLNFAQAAGPYNDPRNTLPGLRYN